MNKLTVLIVLMLAGLSFSVHATESPDRPANVAAKDWMRISDGFGFVVTEEPTRPSGDQSAQLLLADPSKVSAEHLPPKKGYFVIRTEAGWQPVVVTAPLLSSD